MYKILFFALFVVFGLTACSKKPAVYTATHAFGGQQFGVTAKLTLNQFTDKEASDGDGTLEIAKTPGSAWAGREGKFPITWKWFDGRNQVLVNVPSINHAFLMGPNPMATGLLGSDSMGSFWCQQCENVNQGIGVIPGLFVKSS